MLTLRRNPDARQSEGYLVFDGERRVGRIFFADAAAPADRPWFWGMEFDQLRGRVGPQYGQAASRRAAMAAFKAAWEPAADVGRNQG